MYRYTPGSKKCKLCSKEYELCRVRVVQQVFSFKQVTATIDQKYFASRLHEQVSRYTDSTYRENGGFEWERRLAVMAAALSNQSRGGERSPATARSAPSTFIITTSFAELFWSSVLVGR